MMDTQPLTELLINTISSLCAKGIEFGKELRIEGVIGITIDNSNHIIVHIDKCINASGKSDICKANQQVNDDSITSSNFVSNNSLIPVANNSYYTNNLSTENHEAHFVSYSVVKCKAERESYGAQNLQYSNIQGFNNELEVNNLYGNNPVQSSFQRTHFPQPRARGSFSNRRGRMRNRFSTPFSHSILSNPIRPNNIVNNNQTFNGMNWSQVIHFSCQECGKLFNHKSNLLGHQIRVHGRQKNKRGRPFTSPDGTEMAIIPSINNISTNINNNENNNDNNSVPVYEAAYASL